VLEPGDEVALGQSDYRNLAEALARRGLSATYDVGRVLVHAPDPAEAASSRKPPIRAGASSSNQAKKTA
jgi:hypothetical protein